MRSIDFNCDLGEGCGSDEDIVPLISSASIACGGHAGDAASMHQAVATCLTHGVAVGAHPSFDDREHFGRRELDLPAGAIHALVIEQTHALRNICAEHGSMLHHVKPHGALYNLAARDRHIADAIIAAVASIDPKLMIYGLSGSCLTDAAEAAGLPVAHEVFAERAYDANGQLAPRGSAGAVVDAIGASLAQVRGLLRDGTVVARDGSRVRLRADTVCLHGDRPDAVAFARALRSTLEEEGIAIRVPERRA